MSVLHGLTLAFIRAKYSYSHETGVLTSRIKCGRFPAGRVVGTIDNVGYIRVNVNGILIRAHTLIWFIQTGEVPHGIDHINRNRQDNRWCNLRLATPRENCGNKAIQVNNSSGFKGVSFDKRTGRWRVCIKEQPNGRTLKLGRFDSKFYAAAMYNHAAAKYYGEFAYLNDIPGVGRLSVNPDSIELYL